MTAKTLSLPEFSNISIASIETQLDELLENGRAVVEILVAQDAPTWESFALPLQAAEMQLEDFWSPVSHLNGVMNSDELREVYQRCIAKLTEYSTEMGQHEGLYKAFKHLSASEAFNNYSAAQKSWVEHNLRDFKLSGIELEDAAQKRFKAIKQRLAELSQQYSNNVLDATAAWEKLVEDEALLKGLPESALAMLKHNAEQKDQKGYLLTLDFPVYYAVITHAANPAIRKEIYLAYMAKASDQGPNAGEFDNSEIMVETLNLKKELAELLGFENYAERSLATKMAGSVEEVIGFLNNLAEKSLPFAQEEISTLKGFAKARFGMQQLNAWDITYVSEQYRQETFELSEDQVREYFPLEKVLTGMFETVSRLFGIEIKQREAFDSYHEDVRFYEIHLNGDLKAGFYLDLFARDKKRGGAWMADCRSRWQNAEGDLQTPIAFLTCNFRPATGDQPALLSHNEVTTLFHEFGHGLHHMLTEESVAGISGIAGVEWDAVELPSQFMENWCWQEEGLALISEHYQSGEPLPQSMLESMLNAKNFNAGMMMLRQLEFSLFDMLLHCLTHIEDANQIQLLLDQVRDKVAVVDVPDEVRFQHAFSHIFAGGYAAGYYSYKWAEVLSADAFSLFEEKGIFDKASGEAFLQQVLAVGSSRPAAESFKAFRGREPSVDALLKHSGLFDKAA